MLRVFLDANVLFSAAYRERAGLLELWKRPDVELMTSAYAIEEARRNLDTEDRRARLEVLVGTIRVVAESLHPSLPAGIRLHEKDAPILRAAMAAGATHLLTGDLRDFGHLLGHRVGDVLIQTPGNFLKSRS
jgi:predicted nucleic acid-binding protein